VGCVVQLRQSEFSRQNDACDGRWFDRDDLDDAGFATRDMIWLIKIPLVLLVGAGAIWLYSTPSEQVIMTIKRLWRKIRGTSNSISTDSFADTNHDADERKLEFYA